MTDNAFNFWQDHSTQYLEMAFRRDKEGRLENPDGYGIRTGDCGDTVEIFLIVDKGMIEEITYQVNGCVNTNASTNALIELAEKKDIDTAWAVTPEMIADYLETLPKDHYHCAELAVGALYQALADYNKKAVNL
ncbi:MAG: iron-sulfur cluster assembly scaffold protein [Desulfobacterales bacterium]